MKILKNETYSIEMPDDIIILGKRFKMSIIEKDSYLYLTVNELKKPVMMYDVGSPRRIAVDLNKLNKDEFCVGKYFIESSGRVSHSRKIID